MASSRRRLFPGFAFLFWRAFAECRHRHTAAGETSCQLDAKAFDLLRIDRVKDSLALSPADGQSGGGQRLEVA